MYPHPHPHLSSLDIGLLIIFGILIFMVSIVFLFKRMMKKQEPIFHEIINTENTIFGEKKQEPIFHEIINTKNTIFGEKKQSVFKIVYFWKADEPNGILSNFAVTPFTYVSTTNREYDVFCSEQAFMIEKCIFFKENEAEQNEMIQNILNEDNPDTIKKIGRSVQTEEKMDGWKKVNVNIMSKVCHQKFEKNKKANEFLKETKDAELVEASPSDKIWGIGRTKEDDLNAQGKKRPGMNKLGTCLMNIRNFL